MKLKLLLVIFLLAVGTVQAFAVDAPKKKPLTFTADEWCPYICDDKSRPGIIFEIIKEVFNNAGYNTEFFIMPWKRSLDEVENGKYNANALVNIAEGEAMLINKEPIAFSMYKYFVRAGDKWRYNGIKSFESITLGVQEDIDYGIITDYVEKNKDDKEKIQYISAETSFDKNIKKLIAGRIDAFFEDKVVVANYLKENGLEGKIIEAGTSVDPNFLDEEYIYVGFSRKIPESKLYAEILDKGIRELRKSGRLKVILDKYGATDWDNIKANAKQFIQ